MSALSDRPPNTPVGQALAHESARCHVTGHALYTDDLGVRWQHLLHAWPVQSPHAHASVTALGSDAALAIPGVMRVLTAKDVPGANKIGVNHDEELFPSEVHYVGHPVCWVLGDTLEAARLGAEAVEVDYQPLPSVMSLRDAIAQELFQGARADMSRGDVEAGFREAAHIFEGETEMGGQEHFYLETQAALGTLDESGQIFVQSSTQHPSEGQEIIAEVLGVAAHHVTVQSLRMGGGFGGKEVQPRIFSSVAALGTVCTGRPVRVRLNRTQDMIITGKRHPYLATWKVGFGADGRLLALEATVTADGGYSLDLSEAVLARTVCHIDNAYFIPHVHVVGRIAQTNKTSQTAFRGFGGPQGMVVIEDIIGRCAPLLGLEPEELRSRNFYADGQETPYGQPVRQTNRIPDMWGKLLASSDYRARKVEVAEFNQSHAHRKRGLAVTPVKFGISFNFTPLNQGGALVHVYQDGSVLINHGGTEMGQGLHTKMVQVAAGALGLPYESVRLAPTRTDKVPNTSATAASSGADLNGAAVKDACDQIRRRLAPVAAELLAPLAREHGAGPGVSPEDIEFENGLVFPIGHPDVTVTFGQVVSSAYLLRTKLWAAGFYRTEGLHWDSAAFHGEPFKYFAHGIAAAEVEVDGFTGSYRVRRVDILQDVGDSLSPLIDLGQIEGGFIQGVGWLTLEDLRWDESNGPNRGRVTTQAASTYKLPSLSELPEVFNVTTYEQAKEPGAIYGSKAVGEPPFMLALCVREALRTAAAAFGPPGREQQLASPATPEAVYWALQEARQAVVSRP